MERFKNIKQNRKLALYYAGEGQSKNNVQVGNKKLKNYTGQRKVGGDYVSFVSLV